MLAVARSHGMRIVGPNCLGVVSTRCGLNATFTAQRFLPGGIAVAAQSGGVGIAIAAEAEQRCAGISAFVSMGNKVDVSSNDLLRLWADDDDTNVALIYLESFGDPVRFARVARAVSRRMPIVALKAGRTAPGRRAAGSHTAALATDDAVVDALFAHTGVIRARTLEELVDVGLLLDRQPAPAGSRVALIGNAGGPLILGADVAADRGLVVPELSAELQATIIDMVPAAAASNPVDLTSAMNGEQLAAVTQTIAASGEVDACIVVIIDVDESTHLITQSLSTVRRGCPSRGRPCRPRRPAARAVSVRRTGGSRRGARCATGALAGNADGGTRRVGPPPRNDATQLADRPTDRSTATEGRKGAGSTPVLRSSSSPPSASRSLRGSTSDQPLHVPPRRPSSARRASSRATSSESFTRATREQSRSTSPDAEAAGRAYADLVAALRSTGFEVPSSKPKRRPASSCSSASPAIPGSGPSSSSGRAAPKPSCATTKPCSSLRSAGDGDQSDQRAPLAPLLHGYRGRPPLPVDRVAELVRRVSLLAIAVPELEQLDLNPVIVDAAGCVIVDARAAVSDDAAGATPFAGCAVTSVSRSAHDPG